MVILVTLSLTSLREYEALTSVVFTALPNLACKLY